MTLVPISHRSFRDRFNDADLEQAVKWCCLIGMFMNQSQVCTSTSRIYVQDGIYDRFIQLFKEMTEKEILVGAKEDSYHGPLVGVLPFSVLSLLQS